MSTRQAFRRAGASFAVRQEICALHGCRERIVSIMDGETRDGLIHSPGPNGLFNAVISWGSGEHLRAFVDLGATGNFIDAVLAKALRLPLIATDQRLPVSAINGHSLKSGWSPNKLNPTHYASDSTVKHKAMEDYIQESSALGIIWPSTSSARDG
ncbi:hypothetical protein AOLI_G00101200 [Acnodon oligacanthus]